MAYIFKAFIFFLLINLFFVSKFQIITNPMEIIEESDIDDYVIALNSYSVILDESKDELIIQKDPNQIIYEGKSYFLCPSFFLCSDQSNISFLFAENNYYNKTPNICNDHSINSLSIITNLPSEIQYYGFIREKYYASYSPGTYSLSTIKNNEIIIYGKQGDNLYFKYIEDNKTYTLEIDNIKDIISCKLIDSARYVCAYFINNAIKVDILVLNYNPFYGIRLSIQKTIQLNEFTDFDNLILYDVVNYASYKLLCASKKETKGTKCTGIYVTCEYNYYNLDPFTTELSYQELEDGYLVSLYQNHECYITGFNSEFLLCCGDINIIKCYRNSKIDFNTINVFTIDLIGTITNIIISNNSDHALISYKNDTSNKNYLYKYYIYPPKCENKTFEITTFGSLEINLTKIFEKKTNTKYYLKFNNLASDYGIIKIGKEEINSTDSIVELKPEMDYFYFTSNNYNITNNYDIVYNISIKETYSAVCKITLKINACYQSCKNCFENIDSSTDENHNCIDCKEEENYFHYSEEENNCYNEEQIKQKFNHYYFDSQGRFFQKCNLACKTCNGPSENNCLTCENYLLYAYNGNCIPECPNKTFETTDIEGNKICKDCYPNCATCQELGTHANMSCLSCSNNQIKYEKNCFEISDNIVKSFHNPEDYNEITSCQELYGKYIIENTNECIDELKIGYFVSNEQTGILSPCHPDCKTCSRNFTDSNTNCDSCSNETLIVLEGKCVENFSEGYFQNDTHSLKFSYNLILTDTGDYVSECPNGTYLFNGNFTCLKYCPSNYEINEEQNACIIKSYAQTSSDEFKNQILTNITAFVNSSALINGSDFIAVILSSDEMDPKDQLKKGISAVELGNCTKEIKEYYNISKNESLIILNMESKRNETKINEENNRNDNSFDVGKNSQIEIYDNTGRKLNLSVCKENIKIMKYIGDLKEELNIESAMSFADSGIDVFNARDEFFNNICHEYNNKDGKDIIIDDRRTDIYKNVSFCEQGCTYKGMDYELMIANCICDSSIMQANNENNIASNDNKEEKLNFKTLKNSFLESLFDFNFNVINCYNLVFNLKFLKGNIGFYSMMTLFISQLICFFIYLSKKLKSLKKYLLLFNNSNPKTSLSFPPKKYNNSKTIQFNNNNQEKKLVKNSKKNFKNQKEKNKLFTIEEETNNECNTKRKICFMDDENNL